MLKVFASILGYDGDSPLFLGMLGLSLTKLPIYQEACLCSHSLLGAWSFFGGVALRFAGQIPSVIDAFRDELWFHNLGGYLFSQILEYLPLPTFWRSFAHLIEGWGIGLCPSHHEQ